MSGPSRASTDGMSLVANEFASAPDVFRWAERILVHAACLRSHDRLTLRLTDHLSIEGDAIPK